MYFITSLLYAVYLFLRYNTTLLYAVYLFFKVQNSAFPRSSTDDTSVCVIDLPTNSISNITKSDDAMVKS